ncbi:phage terminase large subunit family protein [Helicobacter cappadocius]|uniref:Phage terminase large subunit family protein n=1 Tax=Helicobacter cappadocius TaxID=3063998 RepID=A0AA90Q0E2_9HELI|nr:MULTISPECIES: terminase gpA endonuclease subunit [unclassified Helicobacter]MDO7253902.1 phage terminase large subunit family protein [Helicobacter sp. faydin-H75]MDP2539763.1 phage terminase large subunit family protein [Helicobacter sp. faydin-H76]
MSKSPLIEAFANAIFIKPKLNLTQWSNTYRVLSKESSANFGKFEALSYQIEPMNTISNPDVKEVVLMWGAQLGKSEILNNTIGYYIHQNPSPILFLLPSEDMAEDYSKRRLAPMFRDTKVLDRLINDREASNTILIKNFKGGNLALVGSNSPSKLSSKPIKVLIVDEVDRCENTKEGHSIDLAQKRTNTFYDRKIIKVSTPTIKGHSSIEREYENSDKRRYFVPCPFCEFSQTLVFENIKWEQKEDGSHNLDSVGYACAECGGIWSEREKNNAVSKGKWIAQNPYSSIAGFYLNALYSPFFTLKDIVKDFLESKDNIQKFQVFTNTIKAESFEPPSVKFEENELYARRENYTDTTLPDEVLFISCGIDIQNDRIEMEFRGWGLGFESWGIDYVILQGDVKLPKVWDDAYIATKRAFSTISGRRMYASVVLVDSGFETQKVYKFVKMGKGRFVATKGASEVEMKKDFVNKPKNINGIWLYSIGTYKGKSEVFRLLQTRSFGAGYQHYNQKYTLEYFYQLTSEKLIKTKNDKGYTIYKWEKIRERNEALDISVLNLLGAKLKKLDDFTLKSDS